MTDYVCSECGIINRSNLDLTGMAHTTTGRKPSKCKGRYRKANP